MATDGNECKPCEDFGSVPTHSSPGSSVCTFCEPGEMQSGSGSTCVACEAGKYQNTNTYVCDDCPKGTYQSYVGKLKCETCPNGKSTVEQGSTTDSQCIECSAGSYSKKEFSFIATVEQICLLCPAGKVSFGIRFIIFIFFSFGGGS